MLDNKALMVFLEVARTLNMTKTANQLHMTEPTVSRIIKSLEERLGYRLIKRASRSLTLTASGQLLQQRAQVIVDLVQDLESEFNNLENQISGKINLGLAETPAFRLVAPLLVDMQRRYPQVQFGIESGNAEQVCTKLDAGLYDFGLVVASIPHIENYQVLPLPCPDVWGVILPKDHPLAAKASLTPHDLKDEPLLFSRQEQLASARPYVDSDSVMAVSIQNGLGSLAPQSISPSSAPAVERLIKGVPVSPAAHTTQVATELYATNVTSAQYTAHSNDQHNNTKHAHAKQVKQVKQVDGVKDVSLDAQAAVYAVASVTKQTMPGETVESIERAKLVEAVKSVEDGAALETIVRVKPAESFANQSITTITTTHLSPLSLRHNPHNGKRGDADLTLTAQTLGSAANVAQARPIEHGNVVRDFRGIATYSGNLDPVGDYSQSRGASSSDSSGAIMRPESGEARENQLPPQENPELQWLSASPLRTWFAPYFEQLNIVATFNLIYNAALLVESGMGLSVSIDGLIDLEHHPKLCFRPLNPPLTTSVALIWPRFRSFTPAARLLKDEFLLQWGGRSK